jgi:PleD family two-component response regulator
VDSRYIYHNYLCGFYHSLLHLSNKTRRRQAIREHEAAMNLSLPQRVKIIMTTALDDPRTVIKALFESDANSYLTKPVTVQNIGDELRNLKLIS